MMLFLGPVIDVGLQLVTSHVVENALPLARSDKLRKNKPGCKRYNKFCSIRIPRTTSRSESLRALEKSG